MNAFTYIIAGGLGLLIISLLALGRFYPGSGADVLDWKPTRSVETEVELEVDDLEQMLEAQNARRRRRGEPERTLREIEGNVAADLREQHQRRDAYLADQDTGGDGADEDFQQLLALKNQRRQRRGQPPLSVDELRAELEADRPR